MSYNSETKSLKLSDRLSIFISTAALLISIFATVKGEMNGEKERERTVRSQLTDVLGRIEALSIDGTNLSKENDLERLKIENSESEFEKNQARIKALYAQNVLSMISRQVSGLLDQATYLSDQIPQLVTTIEYNTIASAFSSSNQALKAEVYFKKAIDLAPDAFMKSGATRTYAMFMFPQGRIPEGRELFRQSLTYLKGQDNLVLYENGLTCQYWGMLEKNSGGNSDESNRQFQEAQNYFSRITVEPVKINLLNALEAAKNSKFGNLNQQPVAILPNR